MKKTKTVIGILTAMLLMTTTAIATDSTVDATVSDSAPTVDSVTIEGNDSLDPGSTQTVNVTVSDPNGVSDINATNLTLWNSDIGAEGDSDDWDHYSLSNGTWDTTYDIDSDTRTYEFSQATDTNSKNGTWTAKSYAEDDGGTTASGSSTFTMNTRTGFVLDTPSLTVSGAPGTTDNNFSENPDTMTHDGNINQTIQTNATDLTNGSDTIGVSNMKWNTANDAGTATALSTAYTDVVTSWSRGTYSTAATTDMYWWLDIPSGTPNKIYSGTIELSVV